MKANVFRALSTVGSEEEARSLAQELVERKLAACVNVVSGIRSYYRWLGETCEDEELLLVIKTTAEAFDELSSTLRQLHSYEVPELLRFDVDGGGADYLAWVIGEVSGGAERS